ncbi:hypothetical protein BC826DRAFT_113596 [Russula brevipes]|nr:hypothetical protein BC826DRAFT_113596 [Russula brevipes]
MNMGHDEMQREITMLRTEVAAYMRPFNPRSIFKEDLDQLSFFLVSTLDSQVHSTQGPASEGSCIYRGLVVGIYYQYPLTVPTTSPTFITAAFSAPSCDTALEMIVVGVPPCPSSLSWPPSLISIVLKGSRRTECDPANILSTKVPRILPS